MALGIFPTDYFHKGIDVTGSLGAEIQVVRVLVHIEREDRPTARQPMRVIGGPLVDKAPKTVGPNENGPP